MDCKHTFSSEDVLNKLIELGTKYNGQPHPCAAETIHSLVTSGEIGTHERYLLATMMLLVLKNGVALPDMVVEKVHLDGPAPKHNNEPYLDPFDMTRYPGRGNDTNN